MSGKTPTENRNHLNSLLSESKLNQYFSLGKDSIKEFGT